ncbi:polyamine aminopropyltransferase [Planococcus lenghuensis]|uniref:Polyamine aminopropyltransferase n=1 Tax=Planococcus lenghuensis TaxID=2213202 RepID=A0A1Q2KW22_9BACL|nr:polyamine aminopropyltransferase [Planococcus lenghuensis]AQQ52007.1 spermidine synthase [Planococcus lenghuensis]
MAITKEQRKKVNSIYLSSGLVSICGIVYQVLYGAVGSYLFGDGVLFYSITIGLFLMGMGIGAISSERVHNGLTDRFIQIEYAIAVIGGLSTLGAFYTLAHYGTETSQLYMYLVITLTGALTGLELPILIRKAEAIGEESRKSVARVLLTDYGFSLIGAVGFALVLRPWLGLIQTAFFIAIINISIAIWISFRFRDEIKAPAVYQLIGILLALGLMTGFLYGEKWSNGFEERLYADPIVYSADTNYQRIVMTKEPGDIRLYLDGQLQFAESDEHRYHEALVHVPMSLAEQRSNILLLGGGDGIAVRELLKYPEIQTIDVVDLDPEMTRLATEHAELLRINQGSLLHDKVTVHNADAYQFLLQNQNWYDVIIADLPDPNNEALNKLYTDGFYKLIRNHLNPGGFVSIQSTSPLFATKAYWTISKTVEASDMTVENYHVDVPSFGNWGFTLASREDFTMEQISQLELQVETDYLKEEIIPSLFHFGKDEDEDIQDNGQTFVLEANTMNRPILLKLYSDAWQYY